MFVKEVMSMPAATCHTSSSLAEATAAMWTNDCGSLPVVDDNDHVVGVITDRDICIAAGTRDKRASEIPVSSVISYHASVVHPDDDVSSALHVMETRRVHRVPVVDAENRAVGIVSMNDLILRAEHKQSQHTLRDVDVLHALKRMALHQLPVVYPHRDH